MMQAKSTYQPTACQGVTRRSFFAISAMLAKSGIADCGYKSITLPETNP